MKVIIIGGVAGGATAAARLRRLDESAEIIILERGGYVSYANCGLPYYIGGVIRDKQALSLQSPESFKARFNIDVRVKNEAIAIDPQRKIVRIRQLDQAREYEESYDKLLLSPGAKPLLPALPGIEDERIFTLRTVEDTLRLDRYIKEKKPHTALIVGGGYIGIEMAENLTRAGLRTSVVELAEQIMSQLDFDMAAQVETYLRQKGVALHTGVRVTGFTAGQQGIEVSFDVRERETADLVLMSAGVVPDTALAKAAGLALNDRGAILVNEKMETSLPDIYAAGDAVEVRHFISGEKTVIPLAGPANKQGRIVADQMCGIDSRYHGTQGSSVLRLFDLNVAATGLTERQAKQAGIAYDKTHLFSPSHATYYPGANNMDIKVLFSPDDGSILGAQLVGFDGVDKRCDVLATAIRAGMKGKDLAELELCYAPPFSSAKDPVNMAGFVIENILSGRLKQYHWDEVYAASQEENAVFLDVRTPEEYQAGHIQGAKLIPLDELRTRVSQLEPKYKYYVNCHSGLRSYIACRILAGHGLEAYNLSGGFRLYHQLMESGAFDQTASHPCGLPIVTD